MLTDYEDEARNRRVVAQARLLVPLHGSEQVALALPPEERDRAEAAILGERFGMDPEELAKFLKSAAHSYVENLAMELFRPKHKQKPPLGDECIYDYSAYSDVEDVPSKHGAYKLKNYKDESGPTTRRWEWDDNATLWEWLMSTPPWEGHRKPLHVLAGQVWAFWEDEESWQDEEKRQFWPKFETIGRGGRKADGGEGALPVNEAADFLLAVFQAMDYTHKGSNCASAYDAITKGRKRKGSSTVRVREWRQRQKKPPFRTG